MVVTGREGQVVRSLAERATGGRFEVVPLGRPQLDLAGSSETIAAALETAAPAIIVSAAAYTQVDKAENEQDLAFAVNARGPRAVARAASRLGVPIIHLSTDYVFDGCKTSPYSEEDATGPQGVYGLSKLEGEKAVLAEDPNSAVLRTAWIYSPFGTNFVKTMLRLARDREELSIVSDQRGNPTSAIDLADGIIAVAEQLIDNKDARLRGVFNMAAGGDASWAEFAEAVFAASADLDGPSAKVRRIATAEYPSAARRPANSRLDSSKLARTYGLCLPDWRQSMKQVVKRILDEGA